MGIKKSSSPSNNIGMNSLMVKLYRSPKTIPINKDLALIWQELI